MTATNGINGVNGTHGPRAAGDRPNVVEIRRLLGRAMGVTKATQERLAELIGCGRAAVKDWENGRARPSKVYAAKLAELERRLKEGKVSLDDALRGAGPPMPQAPTAAPALTQPLFANIVSMKANREQALVVFGLTVPGEETPRQVAELLVPRAALERAMELLKLAL